MCLKELILNTKNMFKILGKYVSFFPLLLLSDGKRLENPAKQYFSQSVKGDFMYRDHRATCAALEGAGRVPRRRPRLHPGPSNYSSYNFSHPWEFLSSLATAASRLGSSPQCKFHLNLAMINSKYKYPYMCHSKLMLLYILKESIKD